MAIRILRVLYYALVAAILLYLLVPVLIIVPISFSSAKYLSFPPPGFSLQWYEKFLRDPQWLSALFRSLRVAGLTALCAVPLGGLAASALVRYSFRGKQTLFLFLLSPMIIPVVIVAVSSYFVFARLRMIGSEVSLVLTHVVLTMPVATVVLTATLQGFDWNLHKAALSLGARPWQAFYRVILPGIRPGLLSAALFVFAYSFDELVVALFLAGTTANTLPKRMWESVRFATDPTNSAVATLVIAVGIVVLGLLFLLSRKRPVPSP